MSNIKTAEKVAADIQSMITLLKDSSEIEGLPTLSDDDLNRLATDPITAALQFKASRLKFIKEIIDQQAAHGTSVVIMGFIPAVEGEHHATTCITPGLASEVLARGLFELVHGNASLSAEFSALAIEAATNMMGKGK